MIKNKLLVLLGMLILMIWLPFEINAQEASFYVLPESGSYEVGQSFRVDVLIKSEGVSLNASQATIHFPTDKLRVINISKNNSIFSLWTQEPIWSNSQGTISFGGGLPNPGFRGSSGKVISITFQGKSKGEARIYFKGEAILANDAWGTNIFSFSREGNYSIFETKLPEVEKVPAVPEISSSTHPDQNKWYSNSNPKFQWKVSLDIIAVSFQLNQISVFDPGNISQGVLDSKVFEKVDDGIWYFHLKLKNAIGWGVVSHFKVEIDTKDPDCFEIVVENKGDLTNPYPFLYFESHDDGSGISYYEIKIGTGDVFRFFEVEINPFQMPFQAPGVHSVIIKAIDGAKNFTESNTEVKVESIAAPEITVCPSVFTSGEEIMYVEGTALPSCEVLVFFKKNEQLIKEWQVVSKETGDWFMIEDSLIKSGSYKITARTKDARGAISQESSPCFVKVILSGVAIGPWIIAYKILALIVLIIFIIILAGIFYLLLKVRKIQGLIKKETKDLKKKFYKEYNELQADIEAELEELRRARGKRRITEEEKKREEELLKNLNDVKDVLEKELKDIEKIK